MIILASKSGVRKDILDKHNVSCKVIPSNVDEDQVKDSLLMEGADPELISKNLAELKSVKVSRNNPDILVSNDVEEQTHQVMKNLMDVLKQSGSSLERVTFVRVYLVNFQDFDKVNKIYKSYFDENKLPARTCIGVTGLAVGASVEIDLIAKQ